MKTTVLLKNKLNEIQKLTGMVLQFGKDNNWDEELVGDLRLVLDEIVTNIISYGYKENAAGEIFIGMSYQNQEITIEVRDDAKPFNPLEFSNPDVDKPFEERNEGGLGIYIVRHLMDELEYTSAEGKNFLLMRKNLK